ncbi:MAG: glycosyltransferase family 2 protein [Chloroflexi bacterium]|nr:glycosyltransferase family 2 protein [Chloroflexota bacterium]
MKTREHPEPDAGYRFERDILVGKNIVVVIPAYNEERHIGSIALKLKRFVDTVIVVDDGSSDDTSYIAAAAGAIVVKQTENKGKGEALQAGFKEALKHRFDAVVTIDGDGQHLPEELHKVAGPVLNGNADLVIGSRYLSSMSEVPRHRIWGHKFFNFLTRVASGEPATDSQSGYRAFSPHALELFTLASTGFSVESEMQFIAQEYGLVVKESSITILYEDAPKRSVWQHGLLVLGGIVRLIGQYRPLMFFGVPGALTTLIGMGWGVYVVDIYRRTTTLAVGYAMISVLLTIVGGLTLSTGIILHSVRGLLTDMLRKK